MKKGGLLVFLGLFLLVAFPLLSLVFCSFLPLDLANSFLNHHDCALVFSLSQFHEVLSFDLYQRMLFNSVIIAVSSVVFHLSVSLLSGLMIWKVKCKIKWIKAVYIVALLLPAQSILLPLYHVFRMMRLEHSLGGVILLETFMPLGPLVISTWLEYLPNESFDAAYLETNSLSAILFHVLIPFMLPGLIILAFIAFGDAWNLTEQPLILLSDINMRPLSAFYNNTQYGGDSIAFAGSLIYMIPAFGIVLVISILLRNQSIKVNQLS